MPNNVDRDSDAPRAESDAGYRQAILGEGIQSTQRVLRVLRGYSEYTPSTQWVFRVGIPSTRTVWIEVLSGYRDGPRPRIVLLVDVHDGPRAVPRAGH